LGRVILARDEDMNKITLPEFEPCLKDVPGPFAVAVSGGADSMALLLLTHCWVQEKGGHLVALTVDHGLRPESGQEVLRIQEWAQGRGIQHVILNWEGKKPRSRLQERARMSRYHLLTSWCKENDIPTLLLGHHQQDQEETFWLRLTAGSGLDGLSGMKKKSVRDGIVLVRPLLGFPKERLKETLTAENQPWIEDPSNESNRFFRGRFRSLLKEEGLSFPRLIKVMGKLEEDRDFMNQSLQRALETTVHVDEAGFLTLSRQTFEELHPALAKRVLSSLMVWFSGAPYPPRSEQIARIFEKLKKTTPFTGGGIYWFFSKGKIFLFREFSAIKEKLYLKDLTEKNLWDQRFWIDFDVAKDLPSEIYLAPLGAHHSFKKAIKSPIPRRAWSSLPAFWVNEEVVAVPHLCYNKHGIEKDFQKNISLKDLFHNPLRFTI
jgi:tRNA(Ile)-lysidine synthase